MQAHRPFAAALAAVAVASCSSPPSYSTSPPIAPLARPAFVSASWATVLGSSASGPGSAPESPAVEPAPAPTAEPEEREEPLGIVDEVRVDKSDHRLDLIAKGKVVRSYKVGIGSGGLGPKRWEWDYVTPVGTYTITGRYKLFHQFLAISYPNRDDKIRYAELERRGLVPPGRGIGDGIGLHGGGSHADWTAGCIAVEDHEIDEIAEVVKVGTRILITD